MAKRSKALPVRKAARSRDEDSVLIRTAESLGRMIGSLQRQLTDVTSQVSDEGDRLLDALPELPRLDDVFGGEKKNKRATRTKSSSSRGAAGKKTPKKPVTSRQAAAVTRGRRAGARRSPVRTTAAGRPRSVGSPGTELEFAL